MYRAPSVLRLLADVEGSTRMWAERGGEMSWVKADFGALAAIIEEWAATRSAHVERARSSTRGG